MEEIILRFMPVLDNYPFLLLIVEIITFIFFGGFLFQSIWSLFNDIFKR